MRAAFAGILFGSALVAGNSAVMAHHSLAMFDQDQQIELEGIVREFRFVAPHTFIILDVKQEDGSAESWSLEGVSPSALTREGWSKNSLKPGDELKLKISPLRSGAPGGAWVIQQIKFRDGKPVLVNP